MRAEEAVTSAAGASHLRAALQALFVTVLWSSSWVLIKIGLVDVPALAFAGLRYWLAFLCLLPFAFIPARRRALGRLPARAWGWLIVLGVLYYAVTQGTQYVGLAYLPAVTVSLLLSFSPVAVALLSLPLLGERPAPRQWAGVAISVAGILAYFLPVDLPGAGAFGVAVVIAGTLTNALSSILGRSVNRRGDLDALSVTIVSMGIGSALLLAAGVAAGGLPRLSPTNWAIVVWLAVVNTAFAFTLWNQTLRTLPAVESSIINNTMLVQIGLLAWLFLGEGISLRQGLGMALVILGTLLVQLSRPRGARSSGRV